MKKILISVAVFFLSLFLFPKVVHAEQLIIIKKTTNQLAFYEDGILIETLPVATGRTSDLTPEGQFKIIKMYRNMPYYKKNIPGGDPRNPLGDRWMGLNVPGTGGFTYGIHGTNAEYTIGSHASSGCVRMRNNDVRRLYSRVQVGANVIITNTYDSFEQIANQHGFTFPQKEENIETITLTKAVQTYSAPSKYSYDMGIIQPQKIQIVEKQGKWLHAKANEHDIWFNTTDYSTGNLYTNTILFSTTESLPLYLSPNEDSVMVKTVSSHYLLSNQQINGWYHVQYSSFVNGWVHPTSPIHTLWTNAPTFASSLFSKNS